VLNKSKYPGADGNLKDGIPYNILITQTEVIVIPRKYEDANMLGAGTAVLEMSGEFIVFDQKTADKVTGKEIADELAKTTIENEKFEETIKQFSSLETAVGDEAQGLLCLRRQKQLPVEKSKAIGNDGRTRRLRWLI